MIDSLSLKHLTTFKKTLGAAGMSPPPLAWLSLYLLRIMGKELPLLDLL